MLITVEILKCTNCYHLDHSGEFTKPKPKDICGHSDAVEFATKTIPPADLGKQERYHWRYRVVDVNIIPDWCPLKHGAAY